jgi:hypothetical protein
VKPVHRQTDGWEIGRNGLDAHARCGSAVGGKRGELHLMKLITFSTRILLKTAAHENWRLR